MTSGTATRRNETHRRDALEAVKKEQARKARRRTALVTGGVLLVIAGIVAAMMATSKSTSSSATRTAPDFTLTDTNGKQVHLADFRGRNVLLYFSEGAGCGSCFQQMTAIEKDKADFDKAGLTVLPIVMNTRQELMPELATYGVKTPFLLDNGKVSTAYKTIGHGMHAGLPGHSFVLIDKTGVQRWYGEYPSMWLAPKDLLNEVDKHLAA